MDRLAYHLTSRYESLKLKEFRRDELQDFLDEKAKSGLSFSIVDHLRWDLKQIFDMAVNILEAPLRDLLKKRLLARKLRTPERGSDVYSARA